MGNRKSMNTLPPVVEAMLRASEAHRKQVSMEIASLEDTLDEVITAVELDEADEWDDPSVVREVESVRRVARAR